MRKYGLDVANIPVKNQHQSWNETGMWFRQWNEQKNDFDPEQIKIINNQIVFSDDGFQSTKMAIGKIPIDKNGNTVYAVNAEAILGKLFLGEYLTLQNNSGTYKFDNAGFIAKSGNNSVRIQPNQSGELFSIYKGNNKPFYVDSDGNVHFTGDLTGSSGTFSGNISGGSINLGNGTFTVDENGNMNASSGTFGGTLKGADGTFIGKLKGNEIDGAKISGGTINVGNGNLVVNDDGSAKLGTVNVAKNGLVSVDDLYISSTLKYIGEGAVEEAKDILSRDGRGIITLDIPFITNSNDNGNVHFDRTPFVENPANDEPSYLARELWCKKNFALISSLSSYLTKSDASKYTTNSEVRSIVRSMVKSKYLN